MDDEQKSQKYAKWGAGVLGLSSILAVIAVPGRVGIVIMLGILLFGLLLFGGYFLWQRRRARKNREQFTSEIEVQASAAPRSISDPKKRADLDKVREKFQTGLQEFKSRGKDIYKLPWYVIIGESGSGKTEAIRHSEIDFPPGLNKEHQGSGGTVNMDWWFTNRGIILDTAGSMLFPEAGSQDNNQQWQEFLRLLRKARPQCPINGLFLVLSIESIIRDSADKISQKASRLAQQLDLIQRTLDVRFPVYLLVTKADLLTGFREFFDVIEDPLLQHQIFGWSNPDPLDAPFRPDLVEQHLNSMAERVRRRRMALIRESSSAGRIGDTQHFFASSYQLGRGGQTKKIDEVDSLFAFPESIMRLAPRLRRYLETIFVAGEWSAKPVFLRGIYFTSSMREGKALDEAIAFATGLSLDQLPEDRAWDKNRAFFLRDLFHDKVFRESGLVTRATNTLKMLRQRQLAIFGSAGVALLLLLVFAGFATYRLKRSILAEKAVWETAAANWSGGEWSNAIVKAGSPNPLHFQFAGSNIVEVGSAKPTLLEFHTQLRNMVEKPLAVGWIFAPLKWMNAGNVRARPIGQRLLFEGSVLKPIVRATRDKMQDTSPSAFPGDEAALARHSLAWRYLAQIEAENMLGNSSLDEATTEKYLRAFLSYLADEDWKPNPNLVNVMAWTYSQPVLSKNDGRWPPEKLSGGNSLAANTALKAGLEKFQRASLAAQTNIDQQLVLVNDLAEKIYSYSQTEQGWLNNPAGDCASLQRTLAPLASGVTTAWAKVQAATNPVAQFSGLLARYRALEGAASNASALSLSQPIAVIVSRLPEAKKTSGLFRDLSSYLNELGSRAGENIRTSYVGRPWLSSVDSNCVVAYASNSNPGFFARWSLLSNACAIASTPVNATPEVIGDRWTHYAELKSLVDTFRTNLLAYNGPLAIPVAASCNRLASDAEGKLKNDFVESYVKLVTDTMANWGNHGRWSPADLVAARTFFAGVERDLGRCEAIGSQSNKLASIRDSLPGAKQAVLLAIDRDLKNNVGFPVGLGSPQEKKLAELGTLRKFVDGLTSELTNSVWQSAPPDALSTVQKSCELYGPVINMLVSDSGSATEWQLSFVGSPQTSENMAASIFRYLKVTFDDGKVTVNPDLSSVAANTTAALGKGTADRGVTLAFQRKEADPIAPPPMKYDDWWLARLVKAGEDQPVPVSGAWRIKLKIQDPNRPKDQGFLFLEARPATPNQTLPKDWPR